MSRKIAVAILSLQFLVLAAFAADATKECSLCAGAAARAGLVPPSPIPLLAEVRQDDLGPAGEMLDALTPEQRKKTTVVVAFALDPQKEPLTEVEQHTSAVIDWAKQHGPFAAFGTTVDAADPTIAAYAIKRLAVAAQGQEVAGRIVLGRTPLETIGRLFDAGAEAYFDQVVVDGRDVDATTKWLAARDPSKKILAAVDVQSPNRFFDLAAAFANGATTAYLQNAAPDDLPAIANLDRMLSGDYAYDSTAKVSVLDPRGGAVEMPVLSFVRGEDLRTILVPRGDAATSSIVSLPGDRFTRPRRVDAAGERDVTDVGKKGGHFLIGTPPAKTAYALTVDHAEKLDANVTKEAIEVATHRGISVEEIIRNHQAYKSFQESSQPKYIARDATKLRFSIGDGGEVVEAAIEGDYFSQPAGGTAEARADWVWQDFFINGVRWKYGSIPELPLIQPEKVTQLPLDIHLTNDYHYELVRETDMLGYHTYEVRFEPPPKAPAGLPLYRGTVWIDAHTWARVRLKMIQLNLTGEVLSNEERIDFQPFVRETHAPLTAAETTKADPRTLLWLPRAVEAQQVISAAGRANVVLRSTEFTNFRIDPADFEQALKEASASDARMVRDTPGGGLKYLERTTTGERVIKEGFDTSRKFLVGGIHHDPGLDYPVVPLGGIDYFNFNLGNRGIQTNVFFAGVVLVANATNPNVANTRTNVGVDFFGIAVPTTNSIYRGGVEQKGEAVKALPTSLSIRAGHPFLQFGKIDVSLGVAHESYKRTDETAAGFAIPSKTFVISPSIEAQYSRWGWVVSGFYDYSKRTSWKPWGNLAEYSPEQKSFANFGGGVGKSFYLPKFQRIGVELNYLDGQRLDRFSKYELGFFGSQRVHGIRSGSVRAEKMVLGHLSYGFVFSDQFRLEAFYDHALIDDAVAGYRREPFQGVGIAGQTVGPWGTLLRLDIGKSIGRNRDDGFVANVVFLKLF